MKIVSGDPEKWPFYFREFLVIVQRANAIALQGTFVIEESDD